MSGHAVKSNPIPAFITLNIYEGIENKIKNVYSNISMSPLGSVGKKAENEFNGDIDIAILVSSKDELNNILDNVYPTLERNMNTAPNIISISYPYSIDGYEGNAQVDFMVTDNLEWAKWRFMSPNLKEHESKYKADPKIFLTRFIVTAIPVKDNEIKYFDDGSIKSKYKYTFNTNGLYKQFLNYEGKRGKLKNPIRDKKYQQLISDKPDEVMEFIFGKNYDEKDFHSVEGLWDALHDNSKFKYGDEAIKEVEERFYKEYIYNTKSEIKLDIEDFPCKFFKL